MRGWCEGGLDLALFLLPPVLALVPRGAAPLDAVAGLCAAGLIAADRTAGRLAGLRAPAVLLGGILAWGALSAAWSIGPDRSGIMALRLAGLFAAALALAGAGICIRAPRRLAWCLAAGIAVAVALAFFDLLSGGALSRLVTVRPFAETRLNQLSACLALTTLPLAALLFCRGRPRLALLAGAAMAACVGMLDDTTAKLALAASLPIAALVWWRPPATARIIAAIAVIGILTAPLTLPMPAHSPAVFARVDGFKKSAGHRLLIWSFAGERIVERPFAGWGLDSSRLIPGGKVEIRPGQQWLPLHPHDAALQVWLELGAPGAALFALLVGLLWRRLGAAAWPPPYAAAAGGSLTAALVIAMSGWGIWEEWWLATLSLCLFAVLAIARVPKRG
ncbi:MAG TPA: O-antigen ligase family protein [Stellaceae bacterium]|nr:O-antigen ligase family protein [Stellaceae bacterium]